MTMESGCPIIRRALFYGLPSLQWKSCHLSQFGEAIHKLPNGLHFFIFPKLVMIGGEPIKTVPS